MTCQFSWRLAENLVVEVTAKSAQGPASVHVSSLVEMRLDSISEACTIAGMVRLRQNVVQECCRTAFVVGRMFYAVPVLMVTMTSRSQLQRPLFGVTS